MHEYGTGPDGPKPPARPFIRLRFKPPAPKLKEHVESVWIPPPELQPKAPFSPIEPGRFVKALKLR